MSCFRLHREYDQTGTVDFHGLQPKRSDEVFQAMHRHVVQQAKGQDASRPASC